MVDQIAEISILYDFYGPLLPERQKLFLQLYHEENYSLAEIAEEFHISRQGVHDGVKKAEKTLHELERKLGFVSKFMDTEKRLIQVDTSIERLIAEHTGNESLVKKLEAIRKNIDRLGE